MPLPRGYDTSDAYKLVDQQPFRYSDFVTVGNGSGLQIQNIGSSSFQIGPSYFHLNKILHCPQATSNLISVNQFCYFILTTSDFIVKENLTGKILLQGVVENGLYPLAGFKSSQKNLTCLSANIGVTATIATWHSRLGHPSTAVLDVLCRSNKLSIMTPSNKLDFCSACPLGKATQLPFSISHRQSMVPLALIHSDVWVSPVKSIGGCKYYVLFVDDFSRYSWLYPLQQKSDVFTTFVKFKTIAENLFSTSIKQLQTDNGGEFTSNQFKTFLMTHGIHHRLTCPHTSQQNGIAEQKHRHIQEMRLTLLAQSALPPRYWVDSFLTSVFLINRLPTPVLKNQTPYFLLHNTEPKYMDLLIFGCACYPLLKPYNDHKLDFHSKQCLFLGYSNCQKGYRCLDLATKRVYISRHVVFDEHCFPAKELEVFNSPANQNSPASKSLIIPTSVMSSSLLSLLNFTDIQSQPPTSDPASLRPVLHLPNIPPPSHPEPSPSNIEPIPATHTDQPVVPTIQTRSKTGHS